MIVTEASFKKNTSNDPGRQQAIRIKLFIN